MAAGPSVRATVAFLAEDDLVDQRADRRIPLRHPGHVHAGQPSLQRFQQRHEIPNREHVVLYKNLQILQRL